MIELLPTGMVPLATGERSLHALVLGALYNIDRFDHARFDVWRRGRGGGIDELALKRPPDRLYRIVTDNEREGSSAPLLLGIVVGYTEAARGASALCVVHALGVLDGAGSYDSPLPVPADALEDVTELARNGKLTF